MIAAIHGWIRERGICVVDSIWYHANAARLMPKALNRRNKRNGWVPGRYSSAGSAVWLMTKSSAKPHLRRGIGRTRVAGCASVADMARHGGAPALVDIEERARKHVGIESPQRPLTRRGAEPEAQ